MRAREAGVQTIVAIGNGDGPAQVDCGIRLAEKYDFIYATLGIHPHEARLADEAAYQNMERLAKHPKVIAWGEIGLDYFYDYSPRDIQKNVFVKQMELAVAAKLPIVIHCRPSDGSDDAWEDCLSLMREDLRGFAEGTGRNSALLYGELATGKKGAGYGVHDLIRRQYYVS